MKAKTEEVVEVQEETKIDDERKWCVYCHTNKINGKKYFGITSQDVNERWRNGLGYQNQIVFWRAINKYTWDKFEHEIVIDELTEDEAKQKEIELIAQYKTNCSKYNHPAYGYNMTDGGNGSTGRIASEETREKIGAALKGKMIGDKNPFFGRKHDDETRQKMKENHYDCSGENSSHHSPVYCIQLDELFWGCKDAANKYNVNNKSISACCRGVYKHVGKHPITKDPLQWLYIYDKQLKNGIIAKGAITLGYVTQEQVDKYFNKLNTKGDITYGIMEEK